MNPDLPVVVTGLMGSGKSTVAVPLAAVLGREVLDSDLRIEAARGMTVKQIQAAEGTEALHRVERDELAASLHVRPAAVVTPAASVIDTEEGRALLRPAYVVWLDAPPAVLAERFASRGHRPLYASDPLTMFVEQTERRGPLLASVADLRLDATLPPEDLVQQVLTTLP